MEILKYRYARPELKIGGRNDNQGVIINGNVIASAG